MAHCKTKKKTIKTFTLDFTQAKGEAPNGEEGGYIGTIW
jgi:hypothetical protein